MASRGAIAKVRNRAFQVEICAMKKEAWMLCAVDRQFWSSNRLLRNL
jgi:hypothetical protein